MRALSLLTTCLFPFTVLTSPIAITPGTSLNPRFTFPFSTFSNVVIFRPPPDYNTPRVLYARSVELEGGVLLATWENYSPEPPLVYFPIYRSLDGGVTWHYFSKVTDQVNNWGLRYQPFLYELEEQIGNLPPGTVLLAGNSIPTDLSKTQIDLYASFDKGFTWHFVSHIAAGGEAVPDDGLTPVWEPFILVYKHQLVVYYSDQRDPAHGQKLVHQTSYDAKNWAPPVDDVAYADYYARPGMTTVAHLPNGSYIMTYEYGGGPGFSTYSFPVYYRISDSPLTFNEATGYPVIANGVQPQSSPYVVWTPVGGKFGTIIVSSGTYTQVFTNTELGNPSAWQEKDTPAPVAYTRHLRIFRENKDHLLILGAGTLPPSNNTEVVVSVIDVP